MESRLEIYAPPELKEKDWQAIGYATLADYVRSLDEDNQKLKIQNLKIYAEIMNLPLVSFWHLDPETNEKTMVKLCNDYADLPTESLTYNGTPILTFT